MNILKCMKIQQEFNVHSYLSFAAWWLGPGSLSTVSPPSWPLFPSCLPDLVRLPETWVLPDFFPGVPWLTFTTLDWLSTSGFEDLPEETFGCNNSPSLGNDKANISGKIRVQTLDREELRWINVLIRYSIQHRVDILPDSEAITNPGPLPLASTASPLSLSTSTSWFLSGLAGWDMILSVFLSCLITRLSE